MTEAQLRGQIKVLADLLSEGVEIIDSGDPITDDPAAQDNINAWISAAQEAIKTVRTQ